MSGTTLSGMSYPRSSMALNGAVMSAHQEELPYGGDSHPNSGYAGSDTSQARAEAMDASGETRNNQALVLELAARSRTRGITWHDVERDLGIGHGPASSALSNLHGAKRLARLVGHRERSKVYVLPEHVSGRITEMKGETWNTLMLREAIELLREQATCTVHRTSYPNSTCFACQAGEIVKRYDQRGGSNG